MAGIFDKFFSRFKPAAGGEPEELSLDDALKLIDDKLEKKLSFFYPQYDKICTEILALASGAADAAEELGKSSLDTGNPNYRIGAQMQRNFAERVPAALASLKRPERSYFSYLKFHAGVLETVKSVAKITKDNKYLPFFLSDELGRFGKRMNEVVALADALAHALESQKQDAESLKTANELRQDIILLNKQIVSDSRAKEEIVKRKSAIAEGLASVSESNRGKEAGVSSLRQSVELLNGQISGEKKKVTDQLSPFQRQFRKLQKYVSDKNLAKSLGDYVNDPGGAAMEEVRRSGDYPSLRKILSELKKALEKGEIEDSEKIRSRRISAAEEILAGSILQSIKSAIGLEDRLAGESRRLGTELKSLVHTGEMEDELSHLDGQIADLGKNEMMMKESLESMFSDLEYIASQASGNAIRIRRS